MQRREQEIPLNGGLDIKQSTELQDAGTLRAVTNLRWDAAGELRKRPTHASTCTITAPTGSDYTDCTPEGIYARGGEVFALTKDLGVAVIRPDSPTEALFPQRDVIMSAGTVGDDTVKYAPRACKVSRRMLERLQYNSSQAYIWQAASAVYDNHLVIAWIEGTTTTAYVKAKAFDVDTGAVLSTVQYATALSGAVSISAIPYYASGAEGVMITYAQGIVAPITISAVLYNASTREFGGGGTLTTNARYAAHGVANAPSGDSRFYFAFCDNTTGTMTAQIRTPTVVSTTHTGTASDVSYFAFGVHANAVLILSAKPDTAVYAEVFGTPANRVSAMTSSGSYDFYGITCSFQDTADRAVIVYANVGDDGLPCGELRADMGVRVREVTFATTTPSVGDEFLVPNTWLANSAFTLDSRSYVPLVIDPDGAIEVDNTSVLVCRYYTAPGASPRVEPCARIMHDRYFSVDSNLFGSNPSVTVVDNKVHMVLTGDSTEDDAALYGVTGIRVPQSIFLSTLEFASEHLPLPSVTLDGTTTIASGLALEWDGDIVTEHAPLTRPTVHADVYTVYGTDGSIAQSGTTSDFTNGLANFPLDVVGRTVSISGAVNGGNNGSFTVTARVSDTTVRYTNASGVTESLPVSATWGIGGGDPVAAGTYSFKAIYRWVDAQGRLHRSTPSDAATVTASTISEITVYVKKPMFAALDGVVTTRMEPELYVTEAGGAVYYLANDSDGIKKHRSTTSENFWYVYETVQQGDPANPSLYSDGTDGSEIVPEPPPSFRHIAHIGDRLWAIDAEDTSRVWFTKPLVAGYAPEWSTVCTLRVGDDCVAVTSLGGNPTFLCAKGVWQVYGAGPNEFGVGFFSPAQRIAHECGCIDPLSVCRTPMGVVFRGRRGFYLINDGGQLTPFGVPVDPETRAPSLTDYTYCRVLFDEVANEVRVIDVHGGKYYVFNLLEQKWSEWTQSTSAQNIVDAVVADGRVWYVHRGASSSAVRREYGPDETSTSTESWSVQSPWYKLDGVAGFGRLWELVLQLKLRASSSNVSTLTVTVETRSPEAASDTFTWTGAQLSALASSDVPADLRMHIADQRCKAFRVTITEACTSAYAGSSPVALRAIMGVDGKAVKQTRSGAQKGAA